MLLVGHDDRTNIVLTVGDAIASFLNRSDATTRGRCLTWMLTVSSSAWTLWSPVLVPPVHFSLSQTWQLGFGENANSALFNFGDGGMNRKPLFIIFANTPQLSCCCRVFVSSVVPIDSLVTWKELLIDKYISWLGQLYIKSQSRPKQPMLNIHRDENGHWQSSCCQYSCKSSAALITLKQFVIVQNLSKHPVRNSR